MRLLSVGLTAWALLLAPSAVGKPLTYQLVSAGAGEKSFAYRPAGGWLAGISEINTAADVAVDARDRVIIAGNNVVYRLDRGGVLRRIAGTGRAGSSGDGGAARKARFSDMGVGQRIDLARDGTILIVDNLAHTVRRVGLDGVIETVAGGGDVPQAQARMALDAELSNGPVAADRSKGFYIGSAGLVLYVAGDGSLKVVAGGGPIDLQERPDYRGPATSVRFTNIADLASSDDGSLLIADEDQGLITRLTPDGAIRVVAGQYLGRGTDGGPARHVMLKRPAGLAPLANGGFLIAEAGALAIRRVDGRGRISTVLSSSDRGSTPGATTQLSIPEGVAVDRSGGLVVSDYGAERVIYLPPRTRPRRLVLHASYRRFGTATRVTVRATRRSAGSIRVVANGRTLTRSSVAFSPTGIVVTVPCSPGSRIDIGAHTRTQRARTIVKPHC